MPNYSLKIASERDIPDLVRMAREFALASPYAGYGIDEEKIEETVHGLLTSPLSIAILLCDEGRSVGVLAGTVTEFIFNRDLVGNEIVWWVDPAARHPYSLKMLDAFEYWAKVKQGCKLVSMSSLSDERVNKIYIRKGYRKTEEALIKEL